MATIKKLGGNVNRKPVAEGPMYRSASTAFQARTVSLGVQQYNPKIERNEMFSLNMTATESIEAAVYIARHMTDDRKENNYSTDLRSPEEVLRALADAIEAGKIFI